MSYEGYGDWGGDDDGDCILGMNGWALAGLSVVATAALGGCIFGGGYLLEKNSVKGQLKDMHRAAMFQAAGVSLANAYDIQFLQSPEYRLTSEQYNGTFARFGNACLKGTKFDPSHEGATVVQLDPLHVDVSAADGEKLGLYWSEPRAVFAPRGSNDELIADRYDCAYGMTQFKWIVNDVK